MANICEHSGLSEDACDHCKNGIKRTPRVAKGNWFPAKFEGNCAVCGEKIYVGDPIAYYGPLNPYIGTCCALE